MSEMLFSLVSRALRLLFVFLFCTLIASAPKAQFIDPAAQEILRQQERERQLREREERAPDVRLDAEAAPAVNKALPDNESPCFPIQRIVLKSDTPRFDFALAFTEKNKGRADPAIGRCLGSRGINIVMERIQDALVAAGFVTTRVLAEGQDLTQGTLQLSVISGRVRAIRLSADSDTRQAIFNAVPIRVGDILNLRDIEQGLENLKRVPTAEADIAIEPATGEGAAPGESDLVITWKQGVPLRLSLSADDSGSRSTGKYQSNATLSVDHPFGLNDLFYANFSHDLGGGESGGRGTQGYTLHYSIPFGYWLLAWTNSKNNYHQTVAGVNQDYVYSGVSTNRELKLSRLLYRDDVRKTTLALKGYVKSAHNYIDDTEVEIQQRHMAGWEASLNHKEFIGQASLEGSVSLRHGTGAYGAIAAPEEAFGEGTSRPQIRTFDLQFNGPFTVVGQALRYTSSYRAQWNDTPLIAQDRFSIGGRYTVRGFDGERTLSAERGRLWRNDLSLALGQSGQEFYIAADVGYVSGTSAQYLLGNTLAGAAIGLRGSFKGLSYDVFTGKPLYAPEHFKPRHNVSGFSVNFNY